MLKISNLDKNSIARKVGLKKDDIIISFDNSPALDMLDVAYYDSQCHFVMQVNRNGKTITIDVDKPSWQQMGWDFYDECYLEPRWCANKCIFCFVDQLPKGQRPTLYVKDDDWRLSFVSGNYVTLTNIKDAEVQRIVDKKFSPLYVSVHATDDDVRRRLLGNKNARPIMPLLKQFADAGISMCTQVVMCPGINDKQVLQQTMEDLFSLYPFVQNLAVVPVGLTKHRCNLSQLDLVDKQLANDTINMVEAFDKQCFDKTGEHFVYCSDEMYVYAQRDIPPYSYYGDFNQLENGVGLLADFSYQFDLAFADAYKAKNKSFTVVTGVSAAPFMQKAIDKAKASFPQLKANVVAVTNKFFGETVTVAGLVVGQDIVDTLATRNDIGDVLMLPRVMLREIEDVFLDGMTLQQFKQLTGKEVLVIADGYEFCQAILECE